MDSGAMRSAAPRSMAPLYPLTPSEGSRRRETFGTASPGQEIANEGEQYIPTFSNEGVESQQRWQIAEITRPLCSVGEECDKGQYVMFDKFGGICLNTLTGETRTFPRSSSGAYEMDMWIPRPEVARQVCTAPGFTGPGR